MEPRACQTYVLARVHDELPLDGPHAVLFVLGEQLVAGNHQGVHVGDAASRGQYAVPFVESTNSD